MPIDKIFPLTIVAVPILEDNTYVSSMEYSPLIGGFAITLNDGRAALLTATTLKFDPNVCAIAFALYFINKILF